MQSLLPLAEQLGARLKARGETIAVAESSVGGLISAALLAVPGASAYFLGGAVVYTRQAREALLGIPPAALEGMRPATEAYAQLLARTVRQKFSSRSCGIEQYGILLSRMHSTSALPREIALPITQRSGAGLRFSSR